MSIKQTLIWSILANRAREPSTYVGLILIVAGALGYQLNDETALEIAGGLAVIVGAILTWHRERKSPDHPSQQPARPPFVDERPTPRQTEHSSDADPLPPGGARERWQRRNEGPKP